MHRQPRALGVRSAGHAPIAHLGRRSSSLRPLLLLLLGVAVFTVPLMLAMWSQGDKSAAPPSSPAIMPDRPPTGGSVRGVNGGGPPPQGLVDEQGGGGGQAPAVAAPPSPRHVHVPGKGAEVDPDPEEEEEEDATDDDVQEAMPPRAAAEGEPEQAKAWTGHRVGAAMYVNMEEGSDTDIQAAFRLNMSRVIRHLPRGLQRVQGAWGKRMDLHRMVVNNQLTRESYDTMMTRDKLVGGERLTEGGLGCAASHIDVWQRAAEVDGWTIVFEDDTTLRPNFDFLLKRILKRMPPDAGMLYFGNIIGAAIAESLSDFDDLLWQMDGNHWGTYAYMVSPQAARTLLDHVYPINAQIDSVIMRIAKEQRIKVFMSKQQMVTVDNSAQRVSNVQRYSVEKTIIPMIFHFIWLGGKPLPAKYAGHIEKWKEMYPQATVYIWTETNLPRLKNQARFDAATSYRQKSDIARYEIVLQHGGIYLDTDFEPLRDITPLLHGVRAFVAYESDFAICNGVFGAEAGHPLLRALVENMESNWRKFEHGTINQQTGPHYMTATVKALGHTWEERFIAFSTQIWFPYQWNQPDPGEPYSWLHYAVHHFKEPPPGQ